MAAPLFSIIVPARNAADHLASCIDSVLVQTCDDFEAIIIDDGSTDETASIARRYAAKDARVRMASISHAGVSGARNAGISQATGSYAIFLDADDMLVADALDRISSAFAGEADMVWFGFQYLMPDGTLRDGQRLSEARYANASDALASWIRADVMPVSACNKAYRISVIRGHGLAFREGVGFGEDRLFNIDFLGVCQAIVLMPLNLYVCRVREGSASHSFTPGMLELMLGIHEERAAKLLPKLGGQLSREELDAFGDQDYLQSIKQAWLHLAGHYRELDRDQQSQELTPYLAIDTSKQLGRGKLSGGTYLKQRFWFALLCHAAKAQSLAPLRLAMRITGKLDRT